MEKRIVLVKDRTDPNRKPFRVVGEFDSNGKLVGGTAKQPRYKLVSDGTTLEPVQKKEDVAEAKPIKPISNQERLKKYHSELNIEEEKDKTEKPLNKPQSGKAKNHLEDDPIESKENTEEKKPPRKKRQTKKKN